MVLKTAWEEDAELKGKIEGKIEIILKYLSTHFGEGSKDLQHHVSLLTNLTIVEQLADPLFMISHLDDAQKIVTKAYGKQKAMNEASILKEANN